MTNNINNIINELLNQISILKELKTNYELLYNSYNDLECKHKELINLYNSLQQQYNNLEILYKQNSSKKSELNQNDIKKLILNAINSLNNEGAFNEFINNIQFITNKQSNDKNFYIKDSDNTEQLKKELNYVYENLKFVEKNNKHLSQELNKCNNYIEQYKNIISYGYFIDYNLFTQLINSLYVNKLDTLANQLIELAQEQDKMIK